jgi:thymidylate synthase
MHNNMFIPKSTNISIAWLEVFDALMNKGDGELGPIIVTISEFDDDKNPIEVKAVRERLDKELQALTGRTVDDVASTIFPSSLWNAELKDDGKGLFDRFEKIWPRLQARTKLNAKGSYFQRLTAYPGRDGKPINQLTAIIDAYKSGVRRRSAFQACVFDPSVDPTDQPYQGFPCLQHVAFCPKRGSLSITGYYVLQYAVDRGYGNYLGLCRLGRFMAKQMGLELGQVICISSILTLGKEKRELRELERDLASVAKEANLATQS